MRLGEKLVAAQQLSEAMLAEALEAQVLRGGRLGTNLLELGMVSEETLAKTLGELHRLPVAQGELAADPLALALVGSRLADEKELVPMRVDATRLSVAIINPGDVGTLDTIAFKTGKRVVPVLVPEFRMHQLLRRHYAAFRPLRAIDLEGPGSVRRRSAGSSPTPVPVRADLMSEDAFQSIYGHVLGIDAGYSGAPASVAAPVVNLPTPLPLPPVAPLPALGFAAAQAELGNSQDRNQVAQTVLRFAAGKWKRALLFNVHRDSVTGWRGRGQGIHDGLVPRMLVSLRGANSFQLVRDTRSHFIGPVRKDASVSYFFQLLGGEPATAVLLPLLVRERVAHVLYVDDGTGQTTAPDVGELLILSGAVSRSYDALVKLGLGSSR